jgi:hypothetical protein
MTTTNTAAAQGTTEADADKVAAESHTQTIIDAVSHGESVLVSVGALLAEAQEKHYDTLTGHDSWQSYVSDIIAKSGAKNLGPLLRNEVITSLIKAGVSVRQAAKAAGVSPSVASGVKNGKAPGTNRKGGAKSGVVQRTPAQRLAEDIKAWMDGSEVKSTPDHLRLLDQRLTLCKAQIKQKLGKIVTAEKKAATDKARNGNNPRTGDAMAA